MVRSLLRFFAVVMASLVLRNPGSYGRWLPTSEDVDEIAEPIATMVARRPGLQNALKRFAAPGMLGGGLAAYAMPRFLGLPLPQSPARGQQQQPPAPAAHAEPAPAASADSAANQQAPSPEHVPPERAAQLAVAISGLVDHIRSGIPS